MLAIFARTFPLYGISQCMFEARMTDRKSLPIIDVAYQRAIKVNRAVVKYSGGWCPSGITTVITALQSLSEFV